MLQKAPRSILSVTIQISSSPAPHPRLAGSSLTWEGTQQNGSVRPLSSSQDSKHHGGQSYAWASHTSRIFAPSPSPLPDLFPEPAPEPSRNLRESQVHLEAPPRTSHQRSPSHTSPSKQNPALPSRQQWHYFLSLFLSIKKISSQP